MMEFVEVEPVLQKIWDLHDKLSDAIHSISRTHFLNSVKNMNKSDKKKQYGNENRNGFVYVKGYENESSIAEAKSLNSIRTALENLEDQLEFFHTVQIQQRAERDAALARLEQSRVILAVRLAEHHGKKYKFIEEALNLVGNVQDSSCMVSPDDLSCKATSARGQQLNRQNGVESNLFIRVLSSGLDFAKKSLKLDGIGGFLKLDGIGGILGNAAIFALSMIALMHLQRVPRRDKYIVGRHDKMLRNVVGVNGTSSSGKTDDLDVMLARG